MVKLLHLELQERNGEEHLFYATLNKTNKLNYVVVAYDQNEAIGCGGLRAYLNNTMEMKRMFVPLHHCKRGLPLIILAALEIWCIDLGIKIRFRNR